MDRERVDLFSQGRRDTTEVVYDILTLAQGGVSKSQIVQLGNLNFQLATKYLAQLSGYDLIKVTSWNASSTEKYWLTTKGERVLSLLSDLENELIAGSAGIQIRNHFPGRDFSDPSSRASTSGSPPARQEFQRETWFRWVSPLMIPLAVFLAGIGLGYLLP